MKEKWSMSSSGITESLNIFISRFRCWGDWPQITEQPLMNLCPYLLSLLTACYLQFYIPPGETKWMLWQYNGWKIQKLIKSTGGAWKCNQKTCAVWDYWGTCGFLGGSLGRCLIWDLAHETQPILKSVTPPRYTQRTWKSPSLPSRNLHANWVGTRLVPELEAFLMESKFKAVMQSPNE